MKLVIVALCASLLCTDAIGIQSRKLGGRIIGGAAARAGEFPFAASITVTTSDKISFCTGTLFKNQWIITAGQCVENALLFTIRLGSNSLSANEANVQRFSTDTYFLHPDFDGLTLENDIGLIRLRLPALLTEYVKPISIVPGHPLPDFTNVITIGWGQTSDSVAGTVDKLNYVYLTTLSNEECRNIYGNFILDTMVCVEGNYNEGTCRGDLGSPLIQLGASSLTYLVGISSFISAAGCESTYPSGFSRLDSYVDWINNVTAAF